MDPDPVQEGFAAQVEAHKRQYTSAIHRPVQPCATFNCHGLTFASRRTWIHKPSEVKKILQDDGYEQVQVGSVLPGDIAIYVSPEDGDIHHSGIVVEVIAGLVPQRVKILSKWGSCHEVVHFSADCPYNGHRVTYYRIVR